jgi:hypothetical protein
MSRERLGSGVFHFHEPALSLDIDLAYALPKILGGSVNK